MSWGDDDDLDWCRRCGHPYTEIVAGGDSYTENVPEGLLRRS